MQHIEVVNAETMNSRRCDWRRWNFYACCNTQAWSLTEHTVCNGRNSVAVRVEVLTY